MNKISFLNSKRTLLLSLWLLLAFDCTVSIDARSFRPGQMPNGNVASCSNCHVRRSGGGTRTSFGNAVSSIVRGGGFVEFWSPALAALDSDGDGFTNGEELGDPDGDGIADAGAEVTNPGLASSRPTPMNAEPTISSTPVSTSSFGQLYQYQITAQDPDGDSLSFSKVEGPAWLDVSTAGLVSGTPPENAAGNVSVMINVSDNGTPGMSVTQSYTLSVTASFAGWQNLRFNLGTNGSDAAPDADPDKDGLPNLAEYLLRTDPSVADSRSLVSVEFNSNNQLTMRIQVRDDDPALSVSAEFGNDVGFASASTVQFSETGSDPGNGFKTLTASDNISKSEQNVRFGRVRITQ